jgi:NADPH2:quinone reductase
LGQARHGQVLTEAGKLVDAGQLVPLLSARRYSSSELDAAHAAVTSGSVGRVVVEL